MSVTDKKTKALCLQNQIILFQEIKIQTVTSVNTLKIIHTIC